LFFLGRKYGARVYTFPLIRRLWTPERIATAEDKIRRNGKFICLVARFMPGLRAPIYLTAGIMGVKPAVFLVSDGLAALVSVPIWIYVGNWFGENLDGVLAFAKKLNTGVLAILAFSILGYFVYKKLSSKRMKSSS
jgi:membrane protein DedA with SNARE-associated domain